MVKKLVTLTLLGLFVLAACAPAALPADGEEISWDRAVELLNSGVVTMVLQTHALDVYLTLTNGATVHTIEPTIDAIFDEVQKCGAPCANIVQATE